MAAGARPLRSESEAESYVAESSFGFGHPGRVGIELEWLVFDQKDKARPIAPEYVLSKVSGADLSGQVSTEPGGQLELSSRTAGLNECISNSMADMRSLRDMTARAGLDLVGAGVDPWRQPAFQTELPRYVAMIEAFDQVNEAGRLMLCSTAAIQLSVDAGHGPPALGDIESKWRAAYAIGPILVAAFANSPVTGSVLTGWRSYREATWMRIDPSRTAVPRLDLPPREAWARYALDARVICIRRASGQSWTAPRGLTFRQWVASGLPRRPTLGDLQYHLTTLFPPVRPRGYLELRMIDAQCGDNWIVPAAVAEALLDDAVAMDSAQEAAAALSEQAARSDFDTWEVAARDGVANPLFRKAAAQCFEAALSCLSRRETPKEIVTLIEDFSEKYTANGRMPADDIIESYHGS